IRLAVDRIRDAHRKEADAWNEHINWKRVQFKVGQLVMCWKDIAKTNKDKYIHAKLVSSWCGPYQIINRMTGKDTYQLAGI
ncbi:MAG: hypothetical protein ACK56F_10990, partial [bacterium]